MTEKKLTPDEEADEIVRRLSKPPKRLWRLEDTFMTANWNITFRDDDYNENITGKIAQQISDEIDKEILEELLRCQKKFPNTKTY